MRGRGDTASTDIRESAEGAQRTEQARLHAVMRSACGGHIAASRRARESCASAGCRRLPSRARRARVDETARRQGSARGPHARSAQASRCALHQLSTAPRRPGSWRGFLRGSRFLSTPSTPDPLGRRAATRALLDLLAGQHAQPASDSRSSLRKQPRLCLSSMPSLHTGNPVAMLASVRASTAGARARRERRRGARRRRLIMPHAAGSSRSGLQGRRRQLRATQHFPDKICLALPCLALPCLALPLEHLEHLGFC